MYMKYLLYLLWVPFWYIQLLIPRNKRLWVFGAWFGKEFSDNSKALFDYIRNNHPDIKAIWLTHSKEVCDNVNGAIKINSLKGILASLKAGVVIYSSGISDVNRFFINGAFRVQCWHGAPMKKIGMDDNFHFQPLKNKIIKLLFPFNYQLNQSVVVSTAKIFNDKLSSAFDTKNIWTTGYPRNDILFSTHTNPIIQEWNLKYQNPVKIMYLPTFRDHDKDFNPFKKYKFPKVEFEKYLADSNSILITNAHFVMNKVFQGNTFKRIINLKRVFGQELNYILKDIDILITDYSGVYFDYLLLEKPIILAPFDLNEYKKNSRQLYFNYETEIIGSKAENWEEILNILKTRTYHKPDWDKVKKFNFYHDGSSSERLTKKIIHFVDPITR